MAPCTTSIIIIGSSNGLPLMVVQEKKKRCQEWMIAHATLKKLRKAIGSGDTRMQRGNPGALPVQLPRTSAHCDVLALHSQLAGRLGG